MNSNCYLGYCVDPQTALKSAPGDTVFFFLYNDKENYEKAYCHDRLLLKDDFNDPNMHFHVKGHPGIRYFALHVEDNKWLPVIYAYVVDDYNYFLDFTDLEKDSVFLLMSVGVRYFTDGINSYSREVYRAEPILDEEKPQFFKYCVSLMPDKKEKEKKMEKEIRPKIIDINQESLSENELESNEDSQDENLPSESDNDSIIDNNVIFEPDSEDLGSDEKLSFLTKDRNKLSLVRKSNRKSNEISLIEGDEEIEIPERKMKKIDIKLKKISDNEELENEDMNEESEESENEDINEESEELENEDMNEESEELENEDMNEESEELENEDINEESEELENEDINEESEELENEDINEESEDDESEEYEYEYEYESENEDMNESESEYEYEESENKNRKKSKKYEYEIDEPETIEFKKKKIDSILFNSDEESDSDEDEELQFRDFPGFNENKNEIRTKEMIEPSDMRLLFNDKYKDVTFINIPYQSTYIEPLTKLENLRYLSLISKGNSELRDLNSLSELENLEVLILVNHRKINNSSISELKELKTLVLDGCGVTKIPDLNEPIKLIIRNCNLRNLDGIEDYYELKILNISNTKVNDLTGLEKLALESLDISRTGISFLYPLKGMSSLTYLNAEDTYVYDLEPLSETGVRKLNVKNTGITESFDPEEVPELEEIDVRMSDEEIRGLKERYYKSYDRDIKVNK